MRNYFFPEEEVTDDDLYFVCYMTERITRQLKQPNRYVVNTIGYDDLVKKLSLADVLHSANPLATAADWIEEYAPTPGGLCAGNAARIQQPYLRDNRQIRYRRVLRTLPLHGPCVAQRRILKPGKSTGGDHTALAQPEDAGRNRVKHHQQQHYRRRGRD